MELVWWHWIVLGLVLIGVEMLTPTFFLIWFGLGALLTGVLVASLQLGFAAQLLVWAVASLAMTFGWMRFFRNPDRTSAGMAKEGALGMVGLVTKPVTDTLKGEIIFQRPVLGADRWPIVADTPVSAGQKAKVVDVLGQTLKVVPV
jgi:membrane protein implicated in regulation of membrane protease activity